jgi:hypothetical protein
LAALAAVTGAWLVFIAWQHSSQPLAMVAVPLLVFSPMLAALAISPRADELTDHWLAIERIHRALRFTRGCRAHVGVACAGLFIQGVSQAYGMIDMLDFIGFYAATCALAVAVCLPWLNSRERRLLAQRAEHQRLRRATTPDLRTPVVENGRGDIGLT